MLQHRHTCTFRPAKESQNPNRHVHFKPRSQGNWATDIGGGSQFGYTLLSVVVLSSLMAIFVQALSAKLGIASGRDLAQACRESYSRPAGIALWLAGEIAIAACDLAEVLGSA